MVINSDKKNVISEERLFKIIKGLKKIDFMELGTVLGNQAWAEFYQYSK